MKHKAGFDYCYNSPISVDNKDKIIISQHSSQNENDKKEAGKTIFKKNTGKFLDKLSLDNSYVVSDNILALAGAKLTLI